MTKKIKKEVKSEVKKEVQESSSVLEKVENIFSLTKAEVTRFIDNQKTFIVMTVGDEIMPASKEDIGAVCERANFLFKDELNVKVLVVPHRLSVKVYRAD